MKQNVLVLSVFEVQYYCISIVYYTWKITELTNLVIAHECWNISAYVDFGVIENVG